MRYIVFMLTPQNNFYVQGVYDRRQDAEERKAGLERIPWPTDKGPHLFWIETYHANIAYLTEHERLAWLEKDDEQEDIPVR